MKPRVAVLLVNLGTPAAPTRAAVKPYLAQFLSDPRVLDVAAPLRLFLGRFLIPLVRSSKSAEAYATIWTERGSPLLENSQALSAALASELALPVELGMRYGEPSIERAFLKLADFERIVVVPLYPQYASSSTGTALEVVYDLAARRWNTPALTVLPPFFAAPQFLDAAAELVRHEARVFAPDHVLFSYHGLPERHVKKSDVSGSHCLAHADCCAKLVPANAACYRAQCFATTRGLLERLALGVPSSVAFQSRLGRDPWIRPFTDEVLVELAQSGTKRLLVACPSFVSDCLETLEEIGGRARESFRENGGDELRLVPCVNASAPWVSGLAELVRGVLPAAT
jgi:ferrochelatase